MIQTRTVAGFTAGFLLSLLFALALLGIQSVEFWMNSWLPDPGQPAPITLRLPSFSVFRLHLGQPAELIQKQVIIGRGEVLEPNEDARLAAAYEDTRRESRVGWSLGMFLVYLFASLLLFAELRRVAGDSRLLRTQVIFVGVILAMAAGAKAFLLLTSLPAYYYPMPAVVLLSAFLMGRRVALALNLFTSTIFASLLGFDLSAFVVLFTTSYAGTLFLRRHKKRRTVIQAGSLSGWFGALMLLLLMLVFSGTINVHRELLNPDYSAVLAAVVNGVFSGIVAFLLIEPLGWLIGRVSPTKLIELQDLDNPILKQIRDEAPGTWEHSRAVANMAEAAAAAIGADSLLVRVGAYVHDAGKSLNPAYFIENQTALAITNPHDDIDPEVSADCIFDHVLEGTELLRKHRVPEAIVEFAYTHHGTGLLDYFWFRNMQAGNPKELREKSFRYPGMRPRNRETGILMIVDGIEAASRTIKEPLKHKFEGLVERIIYGKLAQGQLDKCGLSLEDLKTINVTLVDLLVNMFHARIEYPWQRTTITQTGPQSVFQSGQHASFTPGQQPNIATGQHAAQATTDTGQRAGLTESTATPDKIEAPRPKPRGTPIPAQEEHPESAVGAEEEEAAQPATTETLPPQQTRRKVVTKTLTGVAPIDDDEESNGLTNPASGLAPPAPRRSENEEVVTSNSPATAGDDQREATPGVPDKPEPADKDVSTYERSSEYEPPTPEALERSETKENL